MSAHSDSDRRLAIRRRIYANYFTRHAMARITHDVELQHWIYRSFPKHYQTLCALASNWLIDPALQLLLADGPRSVHASLARNPYVCKDAQVALLDNNRLMTTLDAVIARECLARNPNIDWDVRYMLLHDDVPLIRDAAATSSPEFVNARLGKFIEEYA